MLIEPLPLPHDSADAIAHLSELMQEYLDQDGIRLVNKALALAIETCQGVTGERPIPPLEHALAVTTILAEMHIDAIGMSAGLVFEGVDAERIPMSRVESTLGVPTARVVGSMLRLNILERTKQSVAGGAVLGLQQKSGEERDEAS